MGVAFSPWRVQPGSLLPVSVSSCVLVSLHLAHLWKEGKTITNQVQNSRGKTRKDVPTRGTLHNRRKELMEGEGLPGRRAADFFTRFLISVASLSVFLLLLCFLPVSSGVEA